MDELDVIAESKAEAEARVAANQKLVAVMALKAFVEGEDAREIAKLCGFDVAAPPSTGAAGEHVMLRMPGGTFMQMDSDMAGWLGIPGQTQNRDAALMTPRAGHP